MTIETKRAMKKVKSDSKVKIFVPLAFSRKKSFDKRMTEFPKPELERVFERLTFSCVRFQVLQFFLLLFVVMKKLGNNKSGAIKRS